MHLYAYPDSWLIYSRIFFLLGPDQFEDSSESNWRISWPSILSLTVAISTCLGKSDKMRHCSNIMRSQEHSPIFCSWRTFVVELSIYRLLKNILQSFRLYIPPVPLSPDDSQRRSNFNRKEHKPTTLALRLCFIWRPSWLILIAVLFCSMLISQHILSLVFCHRGICNCKVPSSFSSFSWVSADFLFHSKQQ